MCACIFDAVTLVVCFSDVSRLPAPDDMQPNQQLRAAAALTWRRRQLTA